MDVLYTYMVCPELFEPFLISPETVGWPWRNLVASQRRPYCAFMNSHSLVGLVSRQWDTVGWVCVLCDRRIHNDRASRLVNLHQSVNSNLDVRQWKLFEWLRRLLDDSMSEAQIKLWYRRFKDGWDSVESDPHSGKPSTSKTPENVQRVRVAISENRRIAVWELEEALEIPRTIASEILTEDLGKKLVAAKFVPRLLSQE